MSEPYTDLIRGAEDFNLKDPNAFLLIVPYINFRTHALTFKMLSQLGKQRKAKAVFLLHLKRSLAELQLIE